MARSKERKPKDGKDPVEELRELAQLLKRPNPYNRPSELTSHIVQSVILQGNHYHGYEFDSKASDRRPTEIWALPTTNMKLKLDSIGRNTFTITATDGLGLRSRKTVIIDRLSSSEALEILAPEKKEDLDVVSVPLQFRVWFEVKSVSVSSNLLPIIRNKQIRNKLPGDVITEEVPLVVGYNQVQLEVTGTRGEKITRTIGLSRKYTATVVQAPKKPVERKTNSGPQRWAVVVGVSEYLNPGIPPLQYADDDAEAFANFLRSPQGGGYDNDHMRLLLNENATFSNIRDALMDFLGNAIDIDLVMIYFAGHGVSTGSGERRRQIEHTQTSSRNP